MRRFSFFPSNITFSKESTNINISSLLFEKAFNSSTTFSSSVKKEILFFKSSSNTFRFIVLDKV
ncbi:hypothetical protein BZ25_05495 [Petrotoga sp. Shatin.DS.tank11.9.2.9.3]|nr:hypothetical protein BZ25_05495 [Petrotoga sp. Shatin.DS.tank11.9.2.9.3]